jgi:hypothetical protein
MHVQHVIDFVVELKIEMQSPPFFFWFPEIKILFKLLGLEMINDCFLANFK